MKLKNLPLNLLKIIEGKKMIEAIQNTAGLFALLSIGCIIYNKDVKDVHFVYEVTVLVTLIPSIVVIFVTSLIRIWT